MVKEGYTHIIGKHGFQLFKLPEIIKDEIGATINEIKTNPQNFYDAGPTLAGKIEEEYYFNLKSNSFKYITWASREFAKNNKYLIKEINKYRGFRSPNFIMESGRRAWVNFQKKHEYNPMHNHSGVISWVIWYKVPYTFENEKNFGPGKSSSGNVCHGQFEFVYYNGGDITSKSFFEMGKQMEGYILHFYPIKFTHSIQVMNIEYH